MTEIVRVKPTVDSLIVEYAVEDNLPEYLEAHPDAVVELEANTDRWTTLARLFEEASIGTDRF